jgi:hypothetical protein
MLAPIKLRAAMEFQSVGKVPVTDISEWKLFMERNVQASVLFDVGLQIFECGNKLSGSMKCGEFLD